MQPAFDADRLAAGLKAAVESSGTLNDWTVWTIGGTLAVLLSTSYVKPKGIWRAMYIIILPIVFFLGLALWKGFQVQQAQLAFLLRPKDKAIADAPLTLETINAAFALQMDFYLVAVGCLGCWLLVYMFWWIFVDDK